MFESREMGEKESTGERKWCMEYSHPNILNFLPGISRYCCRGLISKPHVIALYDQ